MKFLINASFKAIRNGVFVTANIDAGEFVIDTEDDVKKIPAVATLGEIASANKLSLNLKEKKSVVLENLVTGLTSLNLPEQNEMSESELVKGIVEAGVEAGKTDDEMLLEIVTQGVKFKAAGRLFNQCMEAGGYRLSGKKRTEQINEILEESEFAPENYEEYAAMIERLTSEVNDTSEVQARKAIKAFAKENEIELPKLPAKSKGGIRSKIFDAVIANPAMTEGDLKEMLAGLSKDEETADKHFRYYMPVVEFGQRLLASVSEEVVEAA